MSWTVGVDGRRDLRSHLLGRGLGRDGLVHLGLRRLKRRVLVGLVGSQTFFLGRAVLRAHERARAEQQQQRDRRQQ